MYREERKNRYNRLCIYMLYIDIYLPFHIYIMYILIYMPLFPLELPKMHIGERNVIAKK